MKEEKEQTVIEKTLLYLENYRERRFVASWQDRDNPQIWL